MTRLLFVCFWWQTLSDRQERCYYISTVTATLSHPEPIKPPCSLPYPVTFLPAQEQRLQPSTWLYSPPKPTSQAQGFSRLQKAENFRPIAARYWWHGKHRPKSNAGRPNRAYRMPLPPAWRGDGAAPIPAGTRGVWAMAVPVPSALPRDTAQGHCWMPALCHRHH